MSPAAHFVEYLVIGAAIANGFSLAAALQRSRAAVRNGWHHLTPGPMVWFVVLGGFAFTALLTYIYLFVGSARPDAESQMQTLLVLTVAFNLGTLLNAYVMLAEEVRWNDTRLERRTLFLSRLSIGWHELAAFGLNPWGSCWVSAFDGPKISFSPYNNGFEQLLEKVIENLPNDLPPPELAIAEAALLRATR